jgi:alkylhydroperoxidase/carboxymuconolactone decarboxylase family protein YurZ
MGSDFDSPRHDPGRPPSVSPRTNEQAPADHATQRGLSPRDTSLLNTSIAAAQNRTVELREQLALALANGVTPEQLVDIIDYAGVHAGHQVAHQMSILGDVLREMDER